MVTIYIYWISTVFLSFIYISSAIIYVMKRDWVGETIVGFGYPRYLQPILVAVKVLAVAAIVSRVNVALSDLAYAGAFYHLLLSGLAHIGVRKPKGALPAAIGLALLAASFTTQNAARQTPSPYARSAAEQHVTLIKRSETWIA
ncbi:hypothetical protein PMI01_04176 [Caulobacter sp. AP07]|uniref:DoxX family protein n=1 Tax=Caulobacter sp. AP07 TaxID=1144304 RepID=UPI000271E91F|nr:DoxX family protein [Caulobacter sp. AP07]EJL26005.1 hypothetical protein PMI01_04176 [Caulobacter sp. AP07]